MKLLIIIPTNIIRLCVDIAFCGIMYHRDHWPAAADEIFAAALP